MVDYRFGFTGTQHGMTDAQKATLRDFLAAGSGEFHHGDCIGADSEAHDIADECGYSIVLHPPTNPAKRAWRVVPNHMMKREKPYVDRNKDIVLDTIALIAAPAEPIEHGAGRGQLSALASNRAGRSLSSCQTARSLNKRPEG
jgi:hypothetical protein